MEKDYYKILGIKKDSSIDEIKKAYRMKVRQYHPDINPNLADDNMIKGINLAYEYIIKDKKNENFTTMNDELKKYHRNESQYTQSNNETSHKKEYVNRIYNISNLNFDSIDINCVFVGDVYVIKNKIEYNAYGDLRKKTYLKLKMKDAILLQIDFNEYINLSKIKTYNNIKQLKKDLNNPLKRNSIIIMGDFYKLFIGQQIALEVRLYKEMKSIEKLLGKQLVKKHKKFNLV